MIRARLVAEGAAEEVEAALAAGSGLVEIVEIEVAADDALMRETLAPLRVEAFTAPPPDFGRQHERTGPLVKAYFSSPAEVRDGGSTLDG